MNRNFLCTLILFFILSGTISLFAQPKNRSQLTIEKIMQPTDAWRGAEPDNIYWGYNSQTIYFDWNPERDTLSDIYRINLKGRLPMKVSINEKKIIPGRGMVFSPDYSMMLFQKDGNLYVTDLKKGSQRQLTSFAGRVSSAVFNAKNSKITFVYNLNLFQVDIKSGLITQLTDFIAADERSESTGDRQSRWLESQQLGLFEVLREREMVLKAREKREIEIEAEPLKRIYHGKDQPGQVSLSPSERFVIFTTIQQATAKETNVTHFVTSSGYTEERQARSKVGSPQNVIRLSVFDRHENNLTRINTDNLPGIKDLPDFWDDYPDKKPKEDKISNRVVNLSAPVWNPEFDKAIVVARAHDNKDRWISVLDPLDGILKVIDRQRDEAWIAGPGISGFSGSVGWLTDYETIWFQTEESGYSHLVTVNVNTGERKTLTSGNWEVYNPILSRDGKYFWFTANIKHPGIRHFYRIPVHGGTPEQITSMDGGNEVSLSPDEKWLAIRHSKGNVPWELYLQENRPGAIATKITHSTTPEFESYPWRMPEYVTFTASDGATVYARLYRPDIPVEDGPAVIFVHGAGYLQNAHQWWSSYFREYMFHNFLVDNGYTVLDIDFRGSAGYGRDWRTGIYRHMGGKDLGDQVDGAQWLVQNHNISPGRIGIYGGSYGGFITLMAMFKHPDVFTAGAALRSVTDWAHYNHGYTANILNTPDEDSLAFVQSSPIYFADGLKGALLMCHGMVDDNVQFQDIVRITQRLIELGKDNWELAVYPVESHAFTEPSSWVDEYKRIFRLFEENLKR